MLCLRQRLDLETENLPVGKFIDDLLQLIRLCPLRDTEHSMLMKGYTSEQNVTTVEDGYNTADDGGLCRSLCRVDTKNNTADLFTKHLDGLRTRALAKKMGLRFLDMPDGGMNVDMTASNKRLKLSRGVSSFSFF